MSVWVCIPSARPVPEVEAWCEKWHDMGYLITLWRDREEIPSADLCVIGEYPGWPIASNRLIATVLDADSSCDFCVCGGDDTLPDPNKRADEIAAECSRYFGAHWSRFRGNVGYLFEEKLSTFGVMQPTGDRWGDDAYSRQRWPDAPAMIDRICGSPWIGREFALRINGGNGAWWPEYRHNWADEEMQCVAKALGVLWQRRDLTHYHDHSRRKSPNWAPHQLWFDADYKAMKPLFEKRKAEGFPGSAPLAAIGATK